MSTKNVAIPHLETLCDQAIVSTHTTSIRMHRCCRVAGVLAAALKLHIERERSGLKTNPCASTSPSAGLLMRKIEAP